MQSLRHRVIMLVTVTSVMTGRNSLVIVSVHDQVSKCRKISITGNLSTHLPDLPPAVGARAARHEVELDVGIVEAAVGELGGHPRQALDGN